jgi:hypothetical protein
VLLLAVDSDSDVPRSGDSTGEVAARPGLQRCSESASVTLWSTVDCWWLCHQNNNAI